MHKLNSEELNYLSSRYKEIIPGKWDDFIESLEAPLPSCFWVLENKITSPRLLELLSLDEESVEKLPWHPYGFRLKKSELKIGNSVEYHAGFFHLQEEVSMLPPIILAPKEGEKVLDMCAAPGGKTMQLLHQMNNRGTVVANDWNVDRIKILRSHAGRLGFSNIITMVGDGSRIKDTPETYDKILADVPCSCEGTARKNKNVFSHKLNDEELFQGGIQIGILKKAMELSKAGGEILYSTCTFRPEENEHVINQAIKRTEEWDIVPITLEGFNYSEGLTTWKSLEFHEDLRHALRIWPEQNNSGGFFICKLRRRK